MKGHIAFCPHFHQPHFQLYRTREEAYGNSYEPWLKLLRDAVKLESFFINVHFSGPFLYWMREEKPEFIEEVKNLIASGKIGIIGGLADEPFIQLSSRPDDYLYQLRQYDELLRDTLGIDASSWQGIHLVERECGEILLRELTLGASLLGAAPLFYLDQETFYPAHFSYPGSDNDYCLRHFGFQDPVSITTVSHIPSDLLYYVLRDEIAGREFFVFPIHSQFRYQLLKRQGFTDNDNTRIKPGHYYFYIKDTLEKAAKMAKSYGRDMEPVLLIFEDAEKFGQWSKDAEGDAQWLMEFFSLVDKDPDLSFTGLKQYIYNQGFLDTYPVSSSHSYPEWENWTARRGIRGVSFGDERLRRFVCRIRDLESMQQSFEEGMVRLWQKRRQAELPFSDELVREALMESPRRCELITAIAREQVGEDSAAIYELVNRVRNLVYQEDPKWASRHPSYGSSPYYDAQGLSYLEMALRLIEELNRKIGVPGREKMAVRDWDSDGSNELVMENADQSLVLHREGGCLIYHHILSPELAGGTHIDRDAIEQYISRVSAYHSIHRHLAPLVFTETDSSLTREYYPEGGRREVCRNSLRCEIMQNYNGVWQPLGEFASMVYDIQPAGGAVMMRAGANVNNAAGQPVTITITKQLKIEPGKLSLIIKAESEGDASGLCLVPQIVFSASPSDEINFQPRAYLGLIPGSTYKDTEFLLEQLMVNHNAEFEVFSDKRLGPRPAGIDYIYQVCCGDHSIFSNRVKVQMESLNAMPWLKVEPAVKHYYKGYVFPEQSKLGYHTSGVMISPALLFKDGLASFNAEISWEFDTGIQRDYYERVIDLIR